MDLEMGDTHKANVFTIKFVAFKTPTSVGSGPNAKKTLPSRLFFTFKFYTFTAI